MTADHDRPNRQQRTRGARLGTPTDLAASATAGARWRPTRVRRYGRTDAQITELVCLWNGPFRSRTVRVILVRARTHAPG